MQVFVKKSHTEYDYDIQADWTVGKLIGVVADDFRIREPEKYELTFEGDVMKENDFLMDYGLMSGSQLMLDIKPSERMKRTLRHECRTFGRAALLTCCSRGDLKRFDEILTTGYDLSADKDPDPKTAHFLTVAVKCKQRKMVEHLLDLGFSPNHLKRAGRFIYEYPLKMAIINNDIDMVELLCSHGCDVNLKCDSYGGTPLFFACHSPGRLEIIKKLISLGANPKHTSRHRHTPLSTCVRKCNFPVLKYLWDLVRPDAEERSDLYSLATFMLVGSSPHDCTVRSILREASGVQPNFFRERKRMYGLFHGSKIIPRYFVKSYNNQGHPHWRRAEENRIVQLNAEAESDEIFEFMYSRGGSGCMKHALWNRNRYQGHTAVKRSHIAGKYRKHHSYQ